MRADFDFEELERELDTIMTKEQRDWLAMLLHDHVSGLVANIGLQVEVIHRMMARDMDISEEFASLKENVRTASKHIAAIEMSVRKSG